MLIPPSVPFIIYSAISGESVAKLFIGGIVPGLTIAVMLSALIAPEVKVWLKPELAASTSEVSYTWREQRAA